MRLSFATAFSFFVSTIIPTALSAAEIDTVDCATYAEVADGVAAECGVLRVPENRANPESRIIGVPFARVKSIAEKPQPDPQIFMTGGPGNRGIPRRLTNSNPVLRERDIIFLEQRGTALGEPALQCPEYVEAGYQGSIGALSAKGLAKARIGAAKICADRFRSEGGDLSGYNTVEVSADIEDLRKALGLGQINLYGLSYSGKVMTTYARDFPAAVRGVILNSPLTIEANYDEYGSSGMRRTLDLAIEGCAVDPVCARAYPNLRGRFEKAVERAARKPETVLVNGSDGEKVSVRVDGRVLADTLLNQLYEQGSIEQTPRRINDAFEKGAAGVLEIIDISRSGYAYLQRLAIWCNEEVPFQDEAVVRLQDTLFPEFASVDQSTGPLGLCAAAGIVATPPPSENEPVETNVPVLIFTGELDPATPSSLSASMAAHMPNARHVVVPGAGHGAGFAQCPFNITLAFLHDPMAPLDTACILKMRGADFSKAAAGSQP